LDSRNGHEIIKLLKESNKKYGQTLLLVTHDENIALQADRIIGISDGKVVRDERVRP
jgi:putative ABC transport system ATP-binding protein